MSTRLVPVLLLFLVLPAFPQQSPMGTRLPHELWAERDVRPEPPRASDMQAARLRSIHRDADELSVLSASVQAQLQQLKHGRLPKDFMQNLKKLEKLSKRLRQEVER